MRDNNSQVDDQTYKWVGIMLRVGMYLSFAVMVLGLLMALFSGQTLDINAAQGALLTGVSSLTPLAVLDMGVLLLLITPTATLIAIIITYAAARNWRFAGIASLVGLVLLLSFALAWLRV